jgi:hypothetical protein
LELKKNGNFPMLFSARWSANFGELLFSDVGKDLHQSLDIDEGLKDPKKHKCFSLQELSQVGMQLVSQLEIIHSLGHKFDNFSFKNICFCEKT